MTLYEILICERDNKPPPVFAQHYIYLLYSIQYVFFLKKNASVYTFGVCIYALSTLQLVYKVTFLSAWNVGHNAFVIQSLIFGEICITSALYTHTYIFNRNICLILSSTLLSNILKLQIFDIVLWDFNCSGHIIKLCVVLIANK